MLKNPILALIAFLAFVSSLYAQQINTAKFDSLLTSLNKNNKAMCSIYISKNGKEIYKRSDGYAWISGKNKIKSTADTKYRIGSVSKMFTATMIFQLIEEGRLSLSTPLDKFFPQIPNASTITIGNLLNHHSGVHDFTRDSTYTDWMTEPQTHDEMITAITSRPPTFASGTRGEYSNSNYVLLGYIIEKIAGGTYEKQLKERITNKLELKNTYYGGKTNHAHNEASSFEIDGGKWVPGPETDMSIPGGAGSIVSTPKDLSIFIDALFKHKLVSDSSLLLMTTITDGYGMGMFKAPFYKTYSFGHTGRIDDFTTGVDYFPQDSMVMAMTCNGLDYRMNSIAIGLLKIYYNMPYAIPSFKSVAVSTEILGTYEGIYSSKTIPLKITVRMQNNALTAQATGQSAFPLPPESESKFKFEDGGIEIEFHTSPENKVDRLTIIQDGLPEVFVKE
jgi:D-alanyl-D-alanine carboxypeptidase